MTAAELYEIVKEDTEVWEAALLWVRPGGKVFSEGRWLSNDIWSSNLAGPIAELALEALYARATGCGVSYNHPTDGAVDDGPDARWFAHDWEGDILSHSHPTRLHALRAAYAAMKEKP